MKTRHYILLALSIGLFLGIMIYWREWDLRDEVPIYQVVLWQLVIWSPWILGFMALEKIMLKTKNTKLEQLFLYTTVALLLGLHFGWFFFVSANFSPYIGQYGCRFGVFRYFFIFWTLIDIGLLWLVSSKINAAQPANVSPPLLFELTRGNNKYFCEPSQIHLLASENYYTKLFTTEGVFVMRKPLKSFHDVLPSNMFRKIHRSTIINVNYVSELARGNDHSLEVIMKDGTRRRVSRNFIKEITLFFKDRTS